MATGQRKWASWSQVTNMQRLKRPAHGWPPNKDHEHMFLALWSIPKAHHSTAQPRSHPPLAAIQQLKMNNQSPTPTPTPTLQLSNLARFWLKAFITYNWILNKVEYRKNLNLIYKYIRIILYEYFMLNIHKLQFHLA